MSVQVCFLFLSWGGGGGGVLSTRDFLRFPFLPPFDHPCHLKSGLLSPPRGGGVRHPLFFSRM